jgi:protein-disulfide isomerase
VTSTVAFLASLLVPAAHASDGTSSQTPLALVAGVLLAAAALTFTKRGVGLLVSAVSGLGIATYLYTQKLADAPGKAACDVSDVLSCSTVNSSTYSAVAGVPIALIGAGYFAAVAFLAAQHLRAKGTPDAVSRAPAAIVLLAGMGVAYDAYLAWASTQIGALCLFCAATWVLNVLLLVGALLEARGNDAPLGQAISEGLSAHGMQAGIVGLGVVVLGSTVFDRAPATATVSQGSGADALSGLYEQVGGRIELDGTEATKGPADARFTIVEWADFECPHCAMMVEELEGAMKDNPDLRVLFKHYPISSICNVNVGEPRHAFACSAAAAADCAGKQGAFWELSRAMFKNQKYLAPDDIRFLAREAKLDTGAFETCWNDPTTMDGVRSDVAGGTAAGVTGTPALFLKGAFGEQWVRVNGGKDAINAILKAARAGGPLPAPAAPSER